MTTLVLSGKTVYIPAHQLNKEIEIIVKYYTHVIRQICFDYDTGKLRILSCPKHAPSWDYAQYRDTWLHLDELVEVSPSSRLPENVKWVTL